MDQVFGEEAEKETAKFNEEDIEAILSRRAKRVVAPTPAGGGGDGAAPAASTFSTATFVPDSAGPDIDYDDPLFWEKLMPKAKSAAAAGAADTKDNQAGRSRRGVTRLGFDGAGGPGDAGATKSRIRQAGSEEEYKSDASGSGYGSGPGAAKRSSGWTQSDMKSVKRALLSLGFGRCMKSGTIIINAFSNGLL